jgi:hypothetical protein
MVKTFLYSVVGLGIPMGCLGIAAAGHPVWALVLFPATVAGVGYPVVAALRKSRR